MSAAKTGSSELEQVVHFVEAEHAALTQFIARTVSTRDGLRAPTLALTGALAGVAVNSHSWVIAAVGVPILLGLAFYDRALLLLYKRTYDRIVRLERVEQEYIDSLLESGPLKPEQEKRVRGSLELLQFGLNRGIRPPSNIRVLLSFARPPLISLAAVGLSLVGLWLYFDSESADHNEACIQTDGGVVQVASPVTVRVGEVVLIPCPAR